MKFIVKVHTNSNQPRVVKNPDGSFDVYINVVPEKGKANQAVEKALAKYLKIPVSQVKIIKGGKTKLKTVEVLI